MKSRPSLHALNWLREPETVGSWLSVSLVVALGCLISLSASATTILLNQNFESPVGFMDTTGRDVSQQSVNDLYGNQPPGFSYAQQFTVETLEISGDVAFGGGYSDPGGTAGNYMLGMLSSVQPDLLGLAFDVGDNDFLNISIDVTSIDLDGVGGPFGSTMPTFQFSLFDNPTGAVGLGSGTALDTFEGSGTASDPGVVDFTNFLFGLDASGSTNGNVIVRFDLLTGGYAGFDNLIIAASEFEAEIPIPAVAYLFPAGLLAGLRWMRRHQLHSKKTASRRVFLHSHE